MPELLVALNRAVMQDSGELVTRYDARLQQFIAWLEKFPVPVGVREVAALRGIKVGGPAIPLSPGQERSMAAFREWFKDWLPVVVKECAHA